MEKENTQKEQNEKEDVPKEHSTDKHTEDKQEKHVEVKVEKHTGHEHKVHHKHHHKKEKVPMPMIALLVVAAVIIVFNQVQINAVSTILNDGIVTKHGSGSTSMLGGDISTVNTDHLESTAQTIAAVYPELQGASGEEVMTIMFPTGTPEYGEDLGVSFDDPVESLDTLAKMYNGLKNEVQQSDPEAFARFVNLASNPKGISCEYCCGIGPTGADKQGNSRCGCSHNPGILSLSLYLSAYSDYSDAEILRESMKWKTLWFPKNMIELGASIAGGDASVLESLPGMVGGC
jgi:hypothetical protein